MIDIKEIKKTCPKAYEKLKEWIKGQVLKFNEILTKEDKEKQAFDIPEILIDDTIIEGMLMWNQRQLYEYFQEKNIVANTHYDVDYKTFTALIVPIGKDYWEETGYNTRFLAEDKAFTKAFEELEKTL